jgi:hypothetical protein
MARRNPYDEEAYLTPIDEWSAEKKLVTGLQRRQMGWQTQPFQNEVLVRFDAADLAGKARMLGSFWPKWQHHFEGKGAIPKSPDEVINGDRRRWFRVGEPDDRALVAPRLFAIRYWPKGGCQALYQTVENPRTGGRVVFVDQGGFASEHSMASQERWEAQTGWAWHRQHPLIPTS